MTTEAGKNSGHDIAMVGITGEDTCNDWFETQVVEHMGSNTPYSHLFLILSNISDTAIVSEFGDHPHGNMVLEGLWINATVPPNKQLISGSDRFIDSSRDVIDDIRLTFQLPPKVSRTSHCAM